MVSMPSTVPGRTLIHRHELNPLHVMRGVPSRIEFLPGQRPSALFWEIAAKAETLRTQCGKHPGDSTNRYVLTSCLVYINLKIARADRDVVFVNQGPANSLAALTLHRSNEATVR